MPAVRAVMEMTEDEDRLAEVANLLNLHPEASPCLVAIFVPGLSQAVVAPIGGSSAVKACSMAACHSASGSSSANQASRLSASQASPARWKVSTLSCDIAHAVSPPGLLLSMQSRTAAFRPKRRFPVGGDPGFGLGLPRAAAVRLLLPLLQALVDHGAYEPASCSSRGPRRVRRSAVAACWRSRRRPCWHRSSPRRRPRGTRGGPSGLRTGSDGRHHGQRQRRRIAVARSKDRQQDIGRVVEVSGALGFITSMRYC